MDNLQGVPLSMHREIGQNIFMDKVMGFADASLVEHEKYSFMRNSVSRENLDLSAKATMVRCNSNSKDVVNGSFDAIFLSK